MKTRCIIQLLIEDFSKPVYLGHYRTTSLKDHNF